MAFAWDDIGVAVAVASIHVYLAILENESGDYDAAAVSGKRALSIFDQLGDVIWVPHVLHLLGSIVYHQGHHERASVYLDRARQKFSERNLGWSEAGPLTYLAGSRAMAVN
ncbi:MAG: tetratricopeptide repeat protein [Thermomicrobiales bacterium]